MANNKILAAYRGIIDEYREKRKAIDADTEKAKQDTKEQLDKLLGTPKNAQIPNAKMQYAAANKRIDGERRHKVEALKDAATTALWELNRTCGEAIDAWCKPNAASVDANIVQLVQLGAISEADFASYVADPHLSVATNRVLENYGKAHGWDTRHLDVDGSQRRQCYGAIYKMACAVVENPATYDAAFFLNDDAMGRFVDSMAIGDGGELNADC